MNPPLHQFVQLCQNRLNNFFQQYFTTTPYLANTLKEAMVYSVQNGGKRLRPLIIYSIGHTFDVPLENLDAPACAIELIHAYSLIHDDLPAMDNSDLRRGKPSCHKAFNEATAILAGDALQSVAFEVLTTSYSHLSAEQKVEMVSVLSKASGIAGMAGGQQLDLEGVDSLEALTQMYHLKTGSLFTACIHLACIACSIKDVTIIKALEIYIEQISLAFQIQDDLLDIQGKSHITGKPCGLDNINQKTTYPSILGIEKTQQLIEELFYTATQSLKIFGKKAFILEELATDILKRAN